MPTYTATAEVEESEPGPAGRGAFEELLKCFLMGTHNVVLLSQILDIGELPVAYRARVRSAESTGHTWAAWSTDRGPVAVWGEYDVAGSRRLKRHLVFVEWYTPPNDYHALWCHCGPKRRTEWVVGRGTLDESQ